MGAAAGQRGSKIIREQIEAEGQELITVRRDHLNDLTAEITRLSSVQSDLRRAKALIGRLKAENEVLRDEKRKFMEVVTSTRRHISIAGNAQKQWVVGLVKAQLEKARLI
jgi:hypothetical protein